MDEFLHEYAHIMSDPAHLMAEVTLMLLIDVLFLGLIWPILSRSMHRVADKRVRAEHAVLDAEHGIVHPGGPDATSGHGKQRPEDVLPLG